MFHYFNNLSKFTRTLIVTAFTLTVYGYLCRVLNVYFFWESKTIGWTLVLAAVISCIVERIKQQKQQSKKTLSNKIWVGLIGFVLFMESLLFFTLPHSDAYAAAKQFLFTNGDIKSQVGNVTGFFLVPVGGMAISSNAEGESGAADLTIVVKGTKKYMDVHLLVTKSPNTNWITQIAE